MEVDFLVFADVFLRVLSGGTEGWEEIGYRYYELPFTNMEACRAVLDEWGDSFAEFLEEESRAWWEKELNVDSGDLRIETSAQCEIRPS